jgi:hypothetical protein
MNDTALTRWTGFILLWVGAFHFSGCQALERNKAAGVESPGQPNAARQQGYRLLFDLVGDERNVSKLLLIKHERPELGALIKEISATCAAAYKQIEAFAKADRSLDLRSEVLPAAERQTRDLISKDRGKELLHAKGKNLEVGLLLTQNEALTYGSHLAAVLSQSEAEPARKEFLSRLASNLGQLQAKVMAMLLAHYS